MEKQKNAPILRFPEFKEKWEMNKLGKVMIEGKLGGNYENSESNIGHAVIKMGNIGRGEINLNKVQYLPENEPFNKEDILMDGDLLFNTRNTLELVGKVSIWRNELKFALYNSNLMRMKFNNQFEPTNRFLNALFNTNKSINQLRSFATGTTSVAAIYGRDLVKLNLSYPSFSEQQKIASFLTSIDNKLTQLKKKKTLLEQYKKGVMQKIFSQEIRFKDENGKAFPEWEEKRLGEVAYKNSSNISANKIEENFGEYIIYGASGILKKVDFYKEETEYISIIKDGAGVGRIFYCESKTSVLGTMEIIKPKTELNTYFLYCLLNNIDFIKYITGSTIPHIYFKDYSHEICGIPSLPEQTKIATFLSAIDKKINHSNKQIEKTELWKKGLLQKMFC